MKTFTLAALDTWLPAFLAKICIKQIEAFQILNEQKKNLPGIACKDNTLCTSNS